MCINTWWEGPKEQSQVVSTDTQWQHKDQWALAETQKIPLEHQEKFPYYGSLQVLAEAAQKDCELSISGDIKSCTSS